MQLQVDVCWLVGSISVIGPGTGWLRLMPTVYGVASTLRHNNLEFFFLQSFRACGSWQAMYIRSWTGGRLHIRERSWNWNLALALEACTVK